MEKIGKKSNLALKKVQVTQKLHKNGKKWQKVKCGLEDSASGEMHGQPWVQRVLAGTGGIFNIVIVIIIIIVIIVIDIMIIIMIIMAGSLSGDPMRTVLSRS